MQSNRRDFFKKFFGLAGLGFLFTSSFAKVLQAEERRRGGAEKALELVQPGQGPAANLNYVHNPKLVKDAKLKTARQGIPWGQQSCANCMLYRKHEVRAGEEVGICQIFPNKVVKSSGWCISWSKKT